MKNSLFLAIALSAVISLISCGSGNVQLPPLSKADSLLTFDEAVLRIADFRTKVQGLESNEQKVSDQIKALEVKLNAEVDKLRKCNDDIYASVGASKQDVEAYRERLGRLMGKVNELKALDEKSFEERKNELYTLGAEWNQLRLSKISVLPDYFDKMKMARADIQGQLDRKSVSSSKGYIVREWGQFKDCLWNIAGQSGIYSDPFQWTKIWQANTNIIRNPDVIYPGQELSIPTSGSKSSEEEKAERMYWRNKRR